MPKAKAFTIGKKCKSSYYLNNALVDDPHRRSSYEAPGPGRYNPEQSKCSVGSVSPRGMTIGR